MVRVHPGSLVRSSGFNRLVSDNAQGFRLKVGLRTFRKVAGYGWPGRGANAITLRGMRVRIPCLPL